MYHHRYPIASPKKSSDRKNFLMGGVLILIILGGLAMELIRSGFFTFRDVVAKGSNPQLSSEISSYTRQHFYFLVNSPSSITTRLQTQFPQVDSISLHLDIFSKTLTVSYTPRVSHFLWCKATDCYFADSGGVIFAHSNITQASFLTTVQDQYFLDIAPNKKIPSSYIQALINIENVLQKKNLKIDHFLIDYVFSIKTSLQSGLELRFTLQKPMTEQLGNLITLLDSLTPDEIIKLRYIDLRVKNRIYYK